MDSLPPEEEEGGGDGVIIDNLSTEDQHTTTVVVVDASHLDDQLIFSEAQLAESLAHQDDDEDDMQHHQHDDGGTLIVEGDLVQCEEMEVEESLIHDHQHHHHDHEIVHEIVEDVEDLQAPELPEIDEGHEQEIDSSLMETTDDGEGAQILETILEEEGGVAEDGDGEIITGDIITETTGNDEHQPPPPPAEHEVVEEEEEEEVEPPEPPCACPSCQEGSDECGHFRGWDPTKSRCIICYATVLTPDYLIKRLQPKSPAPHEDDALPTTAAASEEINIAGDGNLEDAETQKIQSTTEEEGNQVAIENNIVNPTPPVTAAPGHDNNVFGIKSEAKDPESSSAETLLTKITGDDGDQQQQQQQQQVDNLALSEGLDKIPSSNFTEDTARQIKEALTEKIIMSHSRPQSENGDHHHHHEEEDGPFNLNLIFQVLSCSFDDLDQDVDLLLNYVPLCHPCQSVVSDAVVIFREIQKLEGTLGNLRDTIKDQVARSFDINYCKRKKENEEIEGLVGQIDATRRAILGEDCPAIAKLLNYRKKGRRGRKPGRKKKTVINRSALYPQVTLESGGGGGSKKRGRPKKQRSEYDASGVKQEFASDPEYEEEFGDDEQEEEHEVIQTHSGRRVKKPNYRKWLMGDDEDDDDEDARPGPIVAPIVKAEAIDEDLGDLAEAASPKSEPDWSPGHSDEEFHEGAESDTSSTDDSDFGANSDEENEFDDDDDEDEDYSESRAPARKRRRSSAGAGSIRIHCPECPRTFADEEKKDKHFARYHEPGGARHGRRRRGGNSLKSHTCDHCDKEFKRPNLLKRHLEKDHGIFPENGESSDKKKHICEFCGQKYRNGSELRVHVRLHTGETPFKCDHCDQSFVSALKRETHIEQCHWEIPPLKCEFCDRAFFRQHRLRIHRITHTGERAYLCEICSQAFSHPTYLKYHQGQHAELNMESYKCKECGKQFANPTNLKLHVKTVHLKEFRFSCEVCGMGFTHMSHKRIHMRGHTGERPYKCEICGESFRYKDRLRIHLRGHTGERPFICDVCKKGFASRSKLKRHEKIHEKSLGNRSSQEEAEPSRPLRYSCDDCGKAFAEPQHLSAHKRYCQRKNFTEKEERTPKATKSTPGKIKTSVVAHPPPAATIVVVQQNASPNASPVPGGATTTVQKIQIEHIPAHAIQGQPTQMLVPVTYTYPVYGYEVAQQQYHTQQQPPPANNVRDYPNYN